MLSGKALDDFNLNVAENGLLDDIWVHDGQIIDGRNRYKACLAAGISPRYRPWNGECGTLNKFVASQNLERRHLDESQRALAAAKLATLRYGANQFTEDTQICVPTQLEAAEMFNVSHRLVNSARKVVTRGIPELITEVEKGEMSVSHAAAIASLPQKKQKRLIRRGRDAGKGRIGKEILRSLKSVKGTAGCICSSDFLWSDDTVSALAKRIAFLARRGGGAKYVPMFEAIVEEIVETNLADKAQASYALILNAIDSGVADSGDIGIRERSDLQRVTKLPREEFDHVITLMLDLRMIEAVQQGGKTDGARGARKVLFKRYERTEAIEEDEVEDVYYDRW